MTIKERLQLVQDKMKDRCLQVNRSMDEVTLIHVSKTQSIETMIEGYNAGMRLFGENKVQEIRDKVDVFPYKDVQWHMIGHLQRNKVKYIVDKVALIHSVDSLRLAQTINEEAQKKGIRVNILVQVNMAMEESKFGLTADEVKGLVKEISQLPALRIQGLMTIAPFVEDPEENRLVFRRMYELYVDIQKQNLDNVSMTVLSMGMSNDFQVAIEEGSTMIRVGTALFGERNYSN